jgi:hypothetical protein
LQALFWTVWILLLVVLPLSLSAALGDWFFLRGWRLAFYAVAMPLNLNLLRQSWPVAVRYWRTRHDG